MRKVYEIPLRIDQEMVYKQMRIDKSKQNFHEFFVAYQELIDEIPDYTKAVGTFRLLKADPSGRFCSALSEVSHIVYVLVTLGKGISERSTKLFLEKDYLKGMMINSIADLILFNATNDFYAIICDEVYNKQNYALTSRFSPDDSMISIKNQALILEKTRGQELLGVTITEGYMYDPLKTLGYVYGADKDIEIARKDHDCSMCGNTSCEFRIEEKSL